MRPAVVNRKVWGGNRTWRGAQTQQVLASILRTLRQQGRDPCPVLEDMLRSPEPLRLELVPMGNGPPR
jgi:transposase